MCQRRAHCSLPAQLLPRDQLTLQRSSIFLCCELPNGSRISVSLERQTMFMLQQERRNRRYVSKRLK